jgi:hypothetical protein
MRVQRSQADIHVRTGRLDGATWFFSCSTSATKGYETAAEESAERVKIRPHLATKHLDLLNDRSCENPAGRGQDSKDTGGEETRRRAE